MLKTIEEIKNINAGAYDICVVGAGAVGIAAAVAFQKRGLSVLVLESGLAIEDRFAQTLTKGHQVDPTRHAPPDIAIFRGLGGTSRWWGGRCVAFDEVDFSKRPQVAAEWPISHAEIGRYYGEAADFLGIGSADFRKTSTVQEGMRDALFEELERWTPVIDMSIVHRKTLEQSEDIIVGVGATVVAVHLSDDCGMVERLTVADARQSFQVAPRRVVLACGGIEGTRLLLAARRDHPDAFGGQNGPLGRYYMGHISGKIADLILDDPNSAAQHDFFLDAGVFVRRRLTLSKEVQLRENLLNVAFWADNPPFHAVDHRNGALSLVWLALAIPPIGRRLLPEAVRLSHLGPPPHRWRHHLWNVICAPISTALTILNVMHARFLSSPRKPGFLLHSSSGRYALHYHGEQTPHRDSRIALSSRCDVLGLPFLDIDLRFCRADAQAIIRAHEVLDRELRASCFGRLAFYDDDPPARLDRVMAQASDGFHQIGTTRMGTDEEDSVVDARCKVHGVGNLYILSTSVFPTSGQASPTLLAVAMAFRLAAHLQ